MDWGGLLRESWRVTRRPSALWGLGAISAAQAALYGFVVLGLIFPMTALTQILVTAGSGAAGAGDPGLAQLQSSLPGIVAWVERWQSLIVAGVLGVFALWVVAGVFDVAASVGAITQVGRIVEGGEASVSRGMRDGFAVWWRTIGLLALAALPSLVQLLVMALGTLFTISIPLSQGLAPDPVAMAGANMLNSVLSPAVSLVAVPLAVVVLLGVRFVAIDGQEWKPAFVSAWRLAKARFAEIAVAYLIAAGIRFAAALCFIFVVTIFIAIAGAFVAVLVASAGTFSGGAMFVTVIASLVLIVLSLAFAIGVTVWSSVLWTLLWRRLTGRDLRPDLPVRPQPMYAAAGYPYPEATGGVSSAQPGPTGDAFAPAGTPTSAPGNR